MSDHFFNRDRRRPYSQDDDQEFYDREYRSRDQSEQGFYDDDGGWWQGPGSYGRGYNQDYSGSNYSRGSWTRSGSDRDFDYGGGYGAVSGRRSRRYGGQGGDYSQGYSRDFDRQRFNEDDERNFSSSYGGYGGYGGYSSRDYGEYGGYQGRSGRFDQGRRRSMERGYGSSYGRGSGGQWYGRGYDQEGSYGQGYDEDYSSSPTSWTYTEIWLVPGPYSGIGPQDYQRSDERIHEDVCERMTQHGQLNARNIQIQVNNGEVTLSGTVDDRQSKRFAEDVAETVSGVKDVHNRIQVQKRQMQGSQSQGSAQQGQFQRSGQQGQAQNMSQGSQSQQSTVQQQGQTQSQGQRQQSGSRS